MLNCVKIRLIQFIFYRKEIKELAQSSQSTLIHFMLSLREKYGLGIIRAINI